MVDYVKQSDSLTTKAIDSALAHLRASFPTTSGTTGSVFNVEAAMAQPRQLFDFVGCGMGTSNSTGDWRNDFDKAIYTDVRELCKSITSSYNSTTMGGSGVSGSGQAPAASYNTSNSADNFNSLDATKLKALQDKEAEIEKTENELKEAKEKKDSAKQKELAKTLLDKQAEYAKLEKEYCGGKSLSTIFGKSNLKFYSNLDKAELDDIQAVNAEIDGLKAKLTDLQKQKATMHDEMQKKINDFVQKNGRQPREEEVYSKAEKEAYLAFDGQEAELRKQISDEIDKLTAYIKKATAEDGEPVSYHVFKVDAQQQEKADAANAKEADTAKTLAAALFDSNGKLTNIETVKKALDGKEGFDKADKNEVARFLLDQLNNMDKNKADEYLGSDDFFKAVAAEQEKFIDGTTDAVKEKRAANLKLLMATYDALRGDKDAFATKLNEVKSNGPDDKLGPLKSAVANIKKADEAKKAAEEAARAAAAEEAKRKAAGTPPKEPPKAPDGKEPPKDQGGERPVDVAKLMGDTTLSDEQKLALLDAWSKKTDLTEAQKKEIPQAKALLAKANEPAQPPKAEKPAATDAPAATGAPTETPVVATTPKASASAPKTFDAKAKSREVLDAARTCTAGNEPKLIESLSALSDDEFKAVFMNLDADVLDRSIDASNNPNCANIIMARLLSMAPDDKKIYVNSNGNQYRQGHKESNFHLIDYKNKNDYAKLDDTYYPKFIGYNRDGFKNMYNEIISAIKKADASATA